jgi:hypothetical protein
MPQFSEFITEASRDTFENWQSEFLQLLWQVVGLAYFLYIGSPSSKENDDRMEAKLDALLRINAGSDQEARLRVRARSRPRAAAQACRAGRAERRQGRAARVPMSNESIRNAGLAGAALRWKYAKLRTRDLRWRV